MSSKTDIPKPARKPNLALQQAMLSAGIKNYQLADAVGLRDSAISLIRVGRKVPASRAIAIKIEEVLGKEGLFPGITTPV